MLNPTTQSVVFLDLISRPIVAAFDQAHRSSNGCGLLLKGIDERIGLSEKLASCLRDERAAGKVRHEIHELFRQRMFAIALGHPDCNDARVLGDNPIHNMMVGRAPISGDSLASQSTLSRFENAVGSGELYRLVETIAETVIDRHRRRLGRKAKTISLDFDPTDDPTHGQQEFAFYHGHYGTHCFLPLIGTIAFNREKRQSLLCAMLRPGDAGTALGLIPILERLLAKVRSAFPKARIRIRLDGGFAVPSVLDYLDEVDFEYVVGLSNWPTFKEEGPKSATTRQVRIQENGTDDPDLL